ncbi:MAG: hypothetical protein K0S32_2277 [Bacteroidetes bacterium]|jgi:hypothetical protein|nr:hypothetical protein [Bacteroidota bacterium]
MLQVEVFRTNVVEKWQAERIACKLIEKFPDHSIHFDLEDREKILRVEAKGINQEKIISVLADSGFSCEVLD